MLQRGAVQRSDRSLERAVAQFEDQLLVLIDRLPVPLRRKLEPLLVRISSGPGAEGENASEGLVSVLGILAQIEKFNATVTVVGETRKIGTQKLQVRTLYWGLAQAIYVDSLGRTAGIGRPGANGWEFEEHPEIAEQAQLLVDIYEGNVDTIDFVKIPVETK